MSKVRAQDMIRLSTGERISLADAIDQHKVYLEERPPAPGAKNPRHFAREYPDGDTLWDISKMLFDSRIGRGEGLFRESVAVDRREDCSAAHIWVFEGDGEIYLDEEAPPVGHIESQSDYAARNAAYDEFDRVVTCGGLDPLSKDFKILRRFQARTGKRI